MGRFGSRSLRLLSSIALLSLLAPLALAFSYGLSGGSYPPGPVDVADVDLIEFPLNLDYLEAEFFLWSALGYGLDKFAPELAGGGPPPVGVQKANLDPFLLDVITQFAYQEVGHLRAIRQTVPGFPRPLLNLSAESFARVFDAAFEGQLHPPFDPYANSLNYLLAAYVMPYVGLTGYVQTNPYLISGNAKRLVAGLLGVKSGQDAVLRALLYDKLNEMVTPYSYPVVEFADRISNLRNTLGNGGIVDEGLFVPNKLGAEGKISGNILAGDSNSVAYGRNAAQILRIVYSTGNESLPGGFFPNGGLGKIAVSLLKHK